MKKTKKYLALALAAGMMLSSMTVFAAETSDSSSTTDAAPSGISNQTSYSGGTVTDAGDYKQFEGSEPTSCDNVSKGDYWYDTASKTTKQWNGSEWVATGCDSSDSSSSTDSSSASSVIPEGTLEKAVEKANAEAAAAAAADEGFTDVAQQQYAQALGKSAGEYYNNAVVKTIGIEAATPVAQGGSLVIDGKVTNATASISKVTVAFVDSAKAAADGTVLNVVDVRFPSLEATVNFYMPGVADNAAVTAIQYVNGAWVDVDVAEVNADHVVLNLKRNGVVAFIAK